MTPSDGLKSRNVRRLPRPLLYRNCKLPYDAVMDIPPPELIPDAPRRDAELSSLLLDAIEDGIYVVDGEFRFAFVNQPLCTLWGKSRHQLIVSTLWDTFPGWEATDEGRRLCQAVFSRRQVTFETFSNVTKQWVRLRVMPLPDGHAAVHWRDFTQEHRDRTAMQWRNERLRRQEEQRARQLARSQARLQAFFDLSPDRLCLFRGPPEGPFRYVDQPCLRRSLRASTKAGDRANGRGGARRGAGAGADPAPS